MASIEHETTSKGEERWAVHYRVNGRLAERWFAKQRAAELFKARVEVDAADGRLIDPRLGARPLDTYFEEWVASRLVKGRPLTPATVVGYRRLYARNIAGHLGRRRLNTLRPDHIRRWNAKVATDASPDQAAKAYRLLRAVLNTAETDQIIGLNPCRIRGAGQEHAEERPMVPTSLVLDIADAIGDRYSALILLAGFAGLRTGENLGLRRGDVDLLHREVKVVRQAQEVAGQGRTVLDPKPRSTGEVSG